MSIVKKILYGVAFVAVFVGFWILLDYLYTTFITQSVYVFRPENTFIYPVCIAVLIYLVLFVFLRKKNK